MSYQIPVKIRAMLGRTETEQGYPMTGIVSTPEGLYLGMVSGFIPRPEPKRKGRPKTPQAKMLSYCRFLAEWANAVTNPQLLESEKAEARRRVFNTTAADHGHDAIQRKSQRDEAECMGWLEVLVLKGGEAHEALIFRDPPTMAAATSEVQMSGLAWRYRDGAVTHGEIVLTVQMRGDLEALRSRIERERTVLTMLYPPDI